jgi:hypothetical protein
MGLKAGDFEPKVAYEQKNAEGLSLRAWLE